MDECTASPAVMGTCKRFLTWQLFWKSFATQLPNVFSFILYWCKSCLSSEVDIIKTTHIVNSLSHFAAGSDLMQDLFLASCELKRKSFTSDKTMAVLFCGSRLRDFWYIHLKEFFCCGRGAFYLCYLLLYLVDFKVLMQGAAQMSASQVWQWKTSTNMMETWH